MKDNSVGGVGVAPNTRIVTLKVLDDNGSGTVSDAIEAYHYAGDHGITIVNASLGGIGSVTAERDAIAANPDVLFVVAAGNGGADDIGDDNDDVNDRGPDGANYPCSYNLPNVLCVGASMHDDQPAEFSNFGATTVDVFAPGYRISSTKTGRRIQRDERHVDGQPARRGHGRAPSQPESGTDACGDQGRHRRVRGRQARAHGQVG